MHWIGTFLLIAVSAFATSPLTVDIDGSFKKVKGKTLVSRVESASLSLLGQPYLDFPLGEGPGAEFDQGPLFRFDGFDCTTFVETTLALATSKKASEFENRLKKIRYRGNKISFEQRNHFPCVDWISHNTKSGLLTDVTAEVAGPLGVIPVTAPIDKKGWYEHLPLSTIRVEGLSEAERIARLDTLKKRGEKYKLETPAFSYIPLDKLVTRVAAGPEEMARRKKEEEEYATKRRGELTALGETDFEKKIHDEVIDIRLRFLIKETSVDAGFLERVPSGAIMNVVRPAWKVPGTNLNISHQGFVIRKPDDVYFRHVNKGGGRAKDVLLSNYLRLCLLSPSIKGIHLLQPAGK